MPLCDRCGKQTNVWIMSYFNTDKLCPNCEKKERNHTEFEEAKRRETEECRQGNYNFPGIGLPQNLT